MAALNAVQEARNAANERFDALANSLVELALNPSDRAYDVASDREWHCLSDCGISTCLAKALGLDTTKEPTDA